MMGCAAAFVLDSPRWRGRLKKVSGNAVVLAAVLFLFGVEPWILGRFGMHTLGHSLADVFMPTFEGGTIAACVLVLVSGADGVVRRVLNRPQVMHVGKISYGLYLWQQFFFFPGSAPGWAAVLWRWLAVYLIATASFYFLEMPMMGLRKKFRRVSV
jgi:peptidoglycan/LPS O-acetylase OafA/YrhL